MLHYTNETTVASSIGNILKRTLYMARKCSVQSNIDWWTRDICSFVSPCCNHRLKFYFSRIQLKSVFWQYVSDL